MQGAGAGVGRGQAATIPGAECFAPGRCWQGRAPDNEALLASPLTPSMQG